MAGVTASIIGISTFAIHLTHTLYNFGSNYATARTQTNRISERITDYVTILDILGSTVEGESEFVSSKALSMIEKLCDQSEDLFYEIKSLLPSGKGRSRGDDLAVLDKVKWNFRKTQVELLLGQLEYVKSNVLLIVMTTMVGKKIRARKKRLGSSRESKSDAQNLKQQKMRAENAIMQHMIATEKLEELRVDAQRENEDIPASQTSSTAMIKINTNNAVALIGRQVETIARFQNAMMQNAEPEQRQAFVINQSPALLRELVAQWTVTDSGDDNEDVMKSAPTRSEPEPYDSDEKSRPAGHRPAPFIIGGVQVRPSDDKRSFGISRIPDGGNAIKPQTWEEVPSPNTNLGAVYDGQSRGYWETDSRDHDSSRPGMPTYHPIVATPDEFEKRLMFADADSSLRAYRRERAHNAE